jgi:ATP-dependent Clp protease ATP-binding subunit ClpA
MSNINRLPLDPLLKSEEIAEFFNALKSRVVGQNEALNVSAEIIQTYKAGLSQQNKPLATAMFLGPSGSGKTFTIQSIAHSLFGDEKGFIRLNCGEFQHASSISTLLGSAPGYLGFKTEKPYFSQEKLDKYKTKEYPINLLLLDEIEKACDSIFQLLLGILDEGILTTASGEIIDFTSTIIFMTSNLGAEGIVDADKTDLGFAPNVAKKLDSQIKKKAFTALEKRFSPEFVNRLTHNVVFNVLTQESVNKILELELLKVRQRIFTSAPHTKFTFICSRKTEEFLLKRGYSAKYGARELKRVIEKYVTNPLASIMMSKQLAFGDIILLSMKNNEIIYDKLNNEDTYNYTDLEWAKYKESLLNIEDEVLEEENVRNVLVCHASESL